MDKALPCPWQLAGEGGRETSGGWELVEEARDVNVGELSLEVPSRARSKSWFCFGLSRCHSPTPSQAQVRAGADRCRCREGRYIGCRVQGAGCQVPRCQQARCQPMQVTGKRDPTSIVQRTRSSRLVVLPRQSPVSRRRCQAWAQAQVQTLGARRGKSKSKSKSAGAATSPVQQNNTRREPRQVPGLPCLMGRSGLWDLVGQLTWVSGKSHPKVPWSRSPCRCCTEKE